MVLKRLANRNNKQSVREPKPPRRCVWRGVAALIMALLVAGLLFYWQPWPTAAASVELETGPVTQGNLAVVVDSSGTVRPVRSVDLSFPVSGTVREVYVKQNQKVKQGQRLAKLDDRELQIQVEQAEADLKSAEASYIGVAEGSATPEELARARASIRGAQAQLEKTRTGTTTPADIAQAEAAVRQAEAQLEKTRTGTTTPADIAQAEAAVRQAEAQLEKAKLGPGLDQVSTAETALRQAQQNYEKIAASTSAAKTTAEKTMHKDADNVRLAQEAYSTAFWNNDQAQSGINPLTGKSFDDENLDAEVQQRQYAEALRQAELQLNQAEFSLSQSQVAFENARQQEINEVAAAKAQVDDSQVQLDHLLKGPRTQVQDVAAAQAQVDQARAALAKLKQGVNRSDIAAAQAQVDQARAALAKLKQGVNRSNIAAAAAQVEELQAGLLELSAPAAQSEIERASANVAQALARLNQAKFKVDQAVLSAPFDGTIASVSVSPGSIAGAAVGGAAVALIDMTSVELIVNLSESDVARVTEGQTVNITLDALPDQTFQGKVTALAPTATEQNNVVTYLVTVEFDPADQPIKVGMTAYASIVVEEREAVIQVPNRAIRSQGPLKYVEVVYGEDKTPVKVMVETGLTNGTTTEIVSCLDTSSQCLWAGDRVLTNVPETAEEGNAQQNNTLIPVGGGSGRPAGPPRTQPLRSRGAGDADDDSGA